MILSLEPKILFLQLLLPTFIPIIYYSGPVEEAQSASVLIGLIMTQ